MDSSHEDLSQGPGASEVRLEEVILASDTEKVWPESRNRTSVATGLPTDLNSDSPALKFRVELGAETYGGPTVASGRLLVGTNNQHPRTTHETGDLGVLMAFSSDDGEFLWQKTHSKAPQPEASDWPEQGLCSPPTVAGRFVHYVSNDGKVVTLDLDGNPVWVFDMASELGVVAHFMSMSSPLRVGNRLFVGTSNGPDDQGNVPAPTAPSFLALDATTGEVLWHDNSPAAGLFEGQWSSPTYLPKEAIAGNLSGGAQVVFGGGDGVLYGFSLDGRPQWSFDLNRSLERAPNDWERGAIVATPVFHQGLLFVASGRNPDVASGPGQLVALEITIEGAQSAWRFQSPDLGFALATVAVGDGRVYLADLNGFVFCLDQDTGEELWRYDTKAPVWASPLLVDGKVVVVDVDGDITVLKHSASLEVVSESSIGEPVFASPVAAGHALFVATRSQLQAFSNLR